MIRNWTAINQLQGKKESVSGLQNQLTRHNNNIFSKRKEITTIWKFKKYFVQEKNNLKKHD